MATKLPSKSERKAAVIKEEKDRKLNASLRFGEMQAMRKRGDRVNILAPIRRSKFDSIESIRKENEELLRKKNKKRGRADVVAPARMN